ncbi:MAG: hypothetical protein RLZZ126_1466 [Pseudomonadota bacterium]|jgi:acyl-coenzyme A thioesterase PaaI-like protein
MDARDLEAQFPEHFAPWVLALGLRIEALGDDPVQGRRVLLRLPHSEALARSGGVLCGQAMMAAADTAMVFALIQHFGEFRPCTTVNMATSFLKPLSHQDCLVEARIVRAGKTMAFGEVDLRGADDGKSVCRASVTYALL